jgi:hypothetical protein
MRSVCGALLMVMALTGSSLADEMYRWKDSSGGLHFETVPAPGERRRREDAAEVPTGDIVADQGGEPVDPSLYDSGDSGDEVKKKKKMTAGEQEALSTDISVRRSQLERELRGTESRIRQIDGQLATLARARTKNTRGSEATGGVAAPAHILSPEEESLVDERDELAQHAVDVRNDAAELRQEVEARLGSVPAWWTDIR